MKKLLLIANICAVLFILAFTGCAKKTPQQIVLKKTGLSKLPSSEVTFYYESHGWFGDGATGIILTFTEEGGEKLSNILSEDIRWTPLPMNDIIYAILYGGPYGEFDSVDFNSVIEVPQIDEGYYFFYDEQTEKYRPRADYITNSWSMNFRIAVFDSQNYKMYYYELDT